MRCSVPRRVVPGPAAETVGKASRGYDAGKKIDGRKRHLVVDTRGLLLLVMVTPADLHDGRAGHL